jgi:putative RecB family exonuclease
MSDPITASKIQMYLTCPRKFAFRYVEKVPPAWKSAALALGSAVHSALQVFHEKRMEGITAPADEVASVFLADFAAQQVDDLRFKDGEDASALAATGNALVRAYVAENAELAVRAVEWPFQVPLSDPGTGEILGPDLRGVFDLLLPDDQIVELKTAARAYDPDTLARNLQLSAYAYAYRQAFGREPTLRIVALLKHKKPKLARYDAARSPETLAWFVHLAAEVARAIEARVFPPNPGWPCTDCEYQKTCAAWRGPQPGSVASPTDGRRHLSLIQDERR